MPESRLKLEQFLAGLPDLGARPQGGMRAADFTLERIRSLLKALDNPQKTYPSIHVAGTNGKGSVCALCVAALRAEGYRVGSFTSPHVEGALQGIRVNGDVVSQGELEETFELISPHLQAAEDWTNFEIVTALAFLHFARAGVDAAVIEVGLGGRLDATNVLKPLVSVITSIDYDHMSILGNTLTQIATEKAGIIKSGVPVVVAPQPAEALEAILAVANAQGAALIEVGKDYLFERGQSDVHGQKVRVWPAAAPGEAVDLDITLLGAHQAENAAVAYAALQAAKQGGLRVAQAAIANGFAAARWPGRFEVLQEDPPVVLDAAHSPAAALSLRAALDEYFPHRPIALVLGVSADKDLEGLLEPLRPRIASAVATQSGHGRAMPAAQLAERLAALGISAAAEPDAAEALTAARARIGDRGLVLVAGSVFLVEQVRANYFNRTE